MLMCIDLVHLQLYIVWNKLPFSYCDNKKKLLQFKHLKINPIPPYYDKQQ